MQIKKIDSQNVLESIQMFGKQCLEAWQEVEKINLPQSYQDINKIVVAGMGGSNLGTDLIRYLYSQGLKVPVEIVADYSLPSYLDEKSLIIVASYSGNTEETVFLLKEALLKRYKILVITSGGELRKIARQHKIPAYIFKPKYNPSGQPRMGLGYFIMAEMGILSRLGLLNISRREVPTVIKAIEKFQRVFGPKNPAKKNTAKKIAQKIKNQIPIIITSEHLSGNAHIIANQINESAKTFASWFLIPEMNHHLLEGLRLSQSNWKNLFFLFLESKLYHPRQRLRYKITREIIKKHKISFTNYKTQSGSKLLECLEVLLFGSYLSFYLAIQNKIDPGPIPWVNYLKERMKK